MENHDSQISEETQHIKREEIKSTEILKYSYKEWILSSIKSMGKKEEKIPVITHFMSRKRKAAFYLLPRRGAWWYWRNSLIFTTVLNPLPYQPSCWEEKLPISAYQLKRVNSSLEFAFRVICLGWMSTSRECSPTLYQAAVIVMETMGVIDSWGYLYPWTQLAWAAENPKLVS